MWNKINNIEIQLGHLNIYDIALKRIKKYCGKKTKNITKEKKQKYTFFEGKAGIFIIEKLTRDIIECCKLRKKLVYNHDDIMVWEETSIAEKIKKLFPHEDIVLNKKFNNRKPDIWFTIIILLLKLMKGTMKIMTQMMKKMTRHV